MLKEGFFLISLDFELQWGSFDKVSLDADRKKELDATLEIIPKILALFEQYKIHATWATVGMLFNINKEDWDNNKPDTIPNYTNKKLCSYLYFEGLENNEQLNKYFFAQESVKAIINSKNQEVASHTYAHYYCLEKEQGVNDFLYDFNQAKKLFSKLNLKLNSLVFPRNQFNEEYYNSEAFKELNCIRTNPDSWYWNIKKGDTLLKRFFRLLDTFNIFSYSKLIDTSALSNQKCKPYKLPSSRFLRSFSSNRILNYFKKKRILLEMSYAAKNGKYYHLWWHPENFGKHPAENLKELELFLKHYTHLNQSYNFQSITMNSFAKKIEKESLCIL